MLRFKIRNVRIKSGAFFSVINLLFPCRPSVFSTGVSCVFIGYLHFAGIVEQPCGGFDNLKKKNGFHHFWKQNKDS